LSLISRIFRITALTEGVSFLLLLGIAMPLKYFANFPEAVSVVGMLHGVLFVLYIIGIAVMTVLYRWSLLLIIGALLSSIVPLGPFFLDKKLRH
jgi:integral membrane protein